MRRLTLRQWVKEHRKEIDAQIHTPYHNDEERMNWIMNNEALYNWAKQEGVKGI